MRDLVLGLAFVAVIGGMSRLLVLIRAELRPNDAETPVSVRNCPELCPKRCSMWPICGSGDE